MIKKYSFKDIFTKEVELISNGEVCFTTKIDVIEIPMIQRDYAQGRLSDSNKDRKNKLNQTGEKFITELFSFLILQSKEVQMELDFVYGSIKKIDDTTYFYPLDGQQRLTTLFLLYWYIGGVELNLDEKKDLVKILSNFYYATRTSSNIFCENLVKELCRDNIDFFLRNDLEEPQENLISQINNLSWFHDSYKLDPTVQSMMNMLDKIQELYIGYNSEKIYKNLDKLRFYILPLSNFDLTEELYVKMNARGKQLTGFENFKADFQNWIKINAKSLGFGEQTYDGRVIPYDMFFINKMDNEWAQCFWGIKKDNANNNFDQLFLGFLYKYWLHEYIYKSKTTNKAIDKERDFCLLRDEPEYLGFSLFERNISKEMVENLRVLLDKISTHYEEILPKIQPCWSIKDAEKFDLLKGNYKFEERVAFSAVVLYLINQDYNAKAFEKWMHVVWNIIENANIDSARVMVGVMQLILELVPYSNDIYSMLANDDIEIKSSQSSVTMKEERLKAKLILSDESWRSHLLKAEAHSYFKGSISFLIPDDEDIEKFKHNYQMATVFFDNNGICQKYRDNSHIFLRALLSRYSSLSQIKYHITDVKEKENALKNMLSSDLVVREAIKEWFALDSEEAIAKKLFEEVKKESPIAVLNDDFEKKLHESLYKKTDLIDWMMERRAIRYKDNYISKPNSWYDWIYVKGYRNEIIDKLTQNGWECENRCYIGEGKAKKAIPYFWSGDKEIRLKKVIQHNGVDVLLKCIIDRSEISICLDDKQVQENYLDSVTYAVQLSDYIKHIDATMVYSLLEL
ncbi:MAG: DUF262 domain-containing protein [Lachnospiraceae bacterium]|nr:DUF262 domain-containing protein [Lachnospiraceae bacterium]